MLQGNETWLDLLTNLGLNIGKGKQLLESNLSATCV